MVGPPALSPLAACWELLGDRVTRAEVEGGRPAASMAGHLAACLAACTPALPSSPLNETLIGLAATVCPREG